MALVEETLGNIPKKLAALLYKMIPNPSGQDQLSDHFLPSFFFTTILLSVPKYGAYTGLVWVALSLYKEFIEDGHWKDFFKRDDGSPYGPGDGRCDLFFRLAGCGVPYLVFLWLKFLYRMGWAW